MHTYILRRLLLMIPTLLGITMVVFGVMAASPGGVLPPSLMQSAEGTADMRPAEREALKRYIMELYGLDRPVHEQYLRWLNNASFLGWVPARVDADRADNRDGRALSKLEAAHTPNIDLILVSPWGAEFDEKGYVVEYQPGFNWAPGLKLSNLGTSSISNQPVIDILKERVPITILLNLLTIPAIYAIAIIIGLYAARNRGKLFDVFTGGIMLGLWSIPSMWAGVMFIGYLANVQYFHWFPIGGLHSAEADTMVFLPVSDDMVLTLKILAGVLVPVGLMLLSVKRSANLWLRGSLALMTVGAAYWSWELITTIQTPIGMWILLGFASLHYLATLGLLLFGRQFALPTKGGFALAVMAPWVFWMGTMLSSDSFHRGYLLDACWHLILPVATLTYGGFAFLAKLTRTAVLENILSDYTRTARAKGVSEQNILWSHVFRNSLMPLITVASTLLPALLAGSVIVESIFSIDGMGRLVIQAVNDRDRELVLSLTLVSGLLTLFSYLVADLCYAIADPRVSYD